MPASYAHFHFGNKALSLLPHDIAQTVLNHRELYNIGLHGPDIFFYYRPFKSNAVNSLGDELHYKSAKEFFAPAREIYLRSKKKPASLAFLLGFLGHYALDSLGHKYVAKKTSESGLAHMQIENEFDRYLLKKEGKEISKTDLTAHIIPSAENAEVISDFFYGVTPKEIKTALSSMKLYSDFLNSRGIKRLATDAVVSLSGMRPKIGHNLVAKAPIPECAETSLQLDALFQKSLDLYPDLAEKYIGYLEGGEYPSGLQDTFDISY